MKFKFCGEGDCPDWVLVEINTLSRISSVKLKVLCQVVAQGIIVPPIDMQKAEKLFADSKLDNDIDLKASIACIDYILASSTRFNCESSALQSELQQLGLPREHSISIKKVIDDQGSNLTEAFKKSSLKINFLKKYNLSVEQSTKCVNFDLSIQDENKSVTLMPLTVNVLLETLQDIRTKMVELKEV